MPRPRNPIANATPSRLDPLLAALIDKLPDPHQGFSHERRAAWIDMMIKAFDVVYGVNDRPPVNIPTPFIHAQAVPVPNVQQFPIIDKFIDAHAPKYVIDPEGFALRDGAAIDPVNIPPNTEVQDYRPEPDAEYAPIMWKSHGSKKMPLPPGVNVVRAKGPWIQPGNVEVPS